MGEEVLIARIEGLEKLISTLSVEREKRVAQSIESIKEASAAALESTKQAIIKAENATEKRFEGVNEFRGQLKDMIDTLARKTEVDYRFQAIESKIDNLQRLVYIGLGIMLALQFLFRFLVK